MLILNRCHVVTNVLSIRIELIHSQINGCMRVNLLWTSHNYHASLINNCQLPAYSLTKITPLLAIAGRCSREYHVRSRMLLTLHNKLLRCVMLLCQLSRF